MSCFNKKNKSNKNKNIINKKLELINNVFESFPNIQSYYEFIINLDAICRLYREINELNSNTNLCHNYSDEELNEMCISQIKQRYFAKMHYYLTNFTEVNSIGFINGFLSDLKKCENSKYSSLFKILINDVQSVIDNHSIIYNNYRKKPIQFKSVPYSKFVLSYILKFPYVFDSEISKELEIDLYKITNLFDYYTSQGILTNKENSGKRIILIRNIANVFPSGLNPNELNYFSVNYINNYSSNSCTNKKLIDIIDNDISGGDFEIITKSLLESNGFINVKVTPLSGDFGVDILAEKDGIKYAIQCKKYSSKVGLTSVQEVIASKAINNSHVAVVLTNNYFTKSAIELASKNNVLLWDRDRLIELLENYSEKP